MNKLLDILAFLFCLFCFILLILNFTKLSKETITGDIFIVLLFLSAGRLLNVLEKL